jgi:hypothetical protein
VGRPDDRGGDRAGGARGWPAGGDLPGPPRAPGSVHRGDPAPVPGHPPSRLGLQPRRAPARERFPGGARARGHREYLRARAPGGARARSQPACARARRSRLRGRVPGRGRHPAGPRVLPHRPRGHGPRARGGHGEEGRPHAGPRPLPAGEGVPPRRVRWGDAGAGEGGGAPVRRGPRAEGGPDADREGLRRPQEDADDLGGARVGAGGDGARAGFAGRLARMGGLGGAAGPRGRVPPRAPRAPRSVRLSLRALRPLRAGLHPHPDRLRPGVAGGDRKVPRVRHVAGATPVREGPTEVGGGGRRSSRPGVRPLRERGRRRHQTRIS